MSASVVQFCEIDTKIDGQAITNDQPITLSSGALLTINKDGSFSYDANGAFDGLAAGELVKDSFTYEVSDGKGGFAQATATVSIIGTAGLLESTAGNDVLKGTWGADTFVWNFGDEGIAGAPAKDIVKGFSLSEGDCLDLSDLLQGETEATLVDYLHFEVRGSDTIINISSSGGYSNGYDASKTDQIIVLQNANLYFQGTNEQIIKQLIDGQNLHID